MNVPVKDLKLSPNMELFKSNVQEVDIEISGYCNRKCPYCPNVLEAGYRRELMDRGFFASLIQDLRTIDFSGSIHLNLFNEPLHDLDYFFWASEQIRTFLPKAKHNVHTNGDYIKDNEMLQSLCKIGLNEICVTIHYPDSWDHERQYERLKTFLDKVGIGFLPIIDQGDFIFTGARGDSTILNFRTMNFSRCGQDRGGTLSGSVCSHTRVRPCHLPRTQVNISYLGEMYPCCNIVPRQEFAGDYCLGKLSETNMFDIYASKASQSFIDCTSKISAATPHLTPKACQTCSDLR